MNKELENKIFNFKQARVPTNSEVEILANHLVENEQELSLIDHEAFKKDFFYIVHDYNEGGKSFSQYIRPNAKINKLKNIVKGCNLILNNIDLENDPHLRRDLSYQNMEKHKVKNFRTWFIYSKCDLSNVLKNLLTPLKKHLEERIDYYDTFTKSRGRRHDPSLFLKDIFLGLFNKYTSISKVENDSSRKEFISLDYLDAAEIFIFSCFSLLEVQYIKISDLSGRSDESKASSLRKFIKSKLKSSKINALNFLDS